jgi:GNAT superfamily N-acetyltransferase
MLQVQQIDPESRATVRRFVDIPFDVYRDDSRWVPPLRRDVALGLDRRRHPFYEHSDAAFFLVQRDGRDVGRIAAIEHKPYNQWHGLRQASFALLECRDQDEDAAAALFERLFDWARARGLNHLVGPKGLSVFDGYGLLVDGFDRRQLMTMTSYNPAWYARLLQRIGFEKEVDFVSYELTRETFVMPETVRRAARRASQRLQIVQYPSRRALIRAARQIGSTYNRAFVNNWEYYPLSDREIDFAVEQMRPVADHRLMTFIAADGEIVGFVLAFADVSPALQRMRGRLTPWGVLGLLASRRGATRVALNGAGILPEYQGRGGNALLYLQIERAVREASFSTAELPLVAETASRMRHDLERLGAVPIKTHRVHRRVL